MDADTAVKQLEDGSVSESQVVETVKAAGIKVTGVSVPATAGAIFSTDHAEGENRSIYETQNEAHSMILYILHE